MLRVPRSIPAAASAHPRMSSEIGTGGAGGGRLGPHAISNPSTSGFIRSLYSTRLQAPVCARVPEMMMRVTIEYARAHGQTVKTPTPGQRCLRIDRHRNRFGALPTVVQALIAQPRHGVQQGPSRPRMAANSACLHPGTAFVVMPACPAATN